MNIYEILLRVCFATAFVVLVVFVYILFKDFIILPIIDYLRGKSNREDDD